MGAEEPERRKGMDELNDRLQLMELIVLEKLGDPRTGREGSLELRMRGIEGTLGGIDKTLRGDGNGDPGFSARLRAVEDYKKAGRKGDSSLIDRVGKLEANQRLIIWGLGSVGTGVAGLAWEWFKSRIFGTGG